MFTSVENYSSRCCNPYLRIAFAEVTLVQFYYPFSAGWRLGLKTPGLSVAEWNTLFYVLTHHRALAAAISFRVSNRQGKLSTRQPSYYHYPHRLQSFEDRRETLYGNADKWDSSEVLGLLT